MEYEEMLREHSDNHGNKGLEHFTLGVLKSILNYGKDSPSQRVKNANSCIAAFDKIRTEARL